MTTAATPDLPLINLEHLPAEPPQRKILTLSDMEQWMQSEALDLIERFIQRLRAASQLDEPEEGTSQALRIVVDFLETIATWVDSALTSGSPASNGHAFKAWLRRVEEAASVLNADEVSPAQKAALPELQHHLLSSFGSAARLDYGTGHELSFLAYLLVLRRISILRAEDEPAIVRRVFRAYLELVGRLQRAFKLEPAGKMGVWGVDENQHLVYFFGASQSRIHPSKRPVSLLSPPSTSPHRIAYLYLSTLLHLHNPSSSPSPSPSSSSSDNEGLLRLYTSEVLHRLPAVQHLRFGPVLRWVSSLPPHTPLPSSADGLSPAALAALDDTLVGREKAEGTVAPWAVPGLSGAKTPEEVLTRLPSPIGTTAVGSQPSTPREGHETSSAPSSPVSGSATGSPRTPTTPLPLPPVVPRPYSAHRLGPRRLSRLSISESVGGADGEEDAGKGEAKEGEEEE
ncbi:hypothetical protein JCM10207_003519 [Rhodosporidiobolus poonsookiae]